MNAHKNIMNIPIAIVHQPTNRYMTSMNTNADSPPNCGRLPSVAITILPRMLIRVMMPVITAIAIMIPISVYNYVINMFSKLYVGF